MMKKPYFVAILVLVSMVIVFGTLAQIIVTKSDKPVLDLRAKLVNGTVYLNDKDIPIDVVFRNVGDKPVRLLGIFDDLAAQRIIFHLKMTDSKGTPIETLGGGKISLSQDSIKYFTLGKDETYTVRLNLKDFLLENYSLKSGSYDVTVIYFNQYGEDCFKGRLKSNPEKLTVAEIN